MLHEGYAEKLGWSARSADEFEEAVVCEFVASVIIYTHKQYKRRVAKGHHLNLDKLTSIFKNNKIRKKIRAFFAAITFRRKKKAE